MSEREPYTAPSAPEQVSSVPLSENQFITFGYTDIGIYASIA